MYNQTTPITIGRCERAYQIVDIQANTTWKVKLRGHVSKNVDTCMWALVACEARDDLFYRGYRETIDQAEAYQNRKR